MKKTIDLTALLKTSGIIIGLILLGRMSLYFFDNELILLFPITSMPIGIGLLYGYFATRLESSKQYILGGALSGGLTGLLVFAIGPITAMLASLSGQNTSVNGPINFWGLFGFLIFIIPLSIVAGAAGGFLWLKFGQLYNSDRATTSKSLQYVEFFSAYIFPVLAVMIVYSAWVLARNNLGFHPRPYQHDPKFLGLPTVKLLHQIGSWFIFALPLPFYFTLRSAGSSIKASNVLYAYISGMLWFLMISIFILDPWDALKWFID